MDQRHNQKSDEPDAKAGTNAWPQNLIKKVFLAEADTDALLPKWMEFGSATGPF